MKRRFKYELLLVALVCFGPLAAAYLFYFYGDLSTLRPVQNEERLLLQPAVPLPPLPDDAVDAGESGPAGWGPKWSLLYVRTSDCDETCRRHLVRLAQVHAALGRDQSRVRRVYLGPDANRITALDPALAGAGLLAPSAAALLDALGSAASPPADAGRVYVVDPHGNLVLSYPPDPEQEGLLDDLERLLDVSQIG